MANGDKNLQPYDVKKEFNRRIYVEREFNT